MDRYETDNIKIENTKNNEVVRQMLHQKVKSMGKCAYVECYECALGIKNPLDEDFIICLLIHI